MFAVPILLAALVPSDAAPSELVLASYSLEAIVPPASDGGIELAILPYEPRYVTLSRGGFESRARRVGAENIVDLVRRVVTPEEWEAPGRFIEVIPRGDSESLRVRAPAQVHSEVQRCLAFLGSHFRRTARVKFRAFSIAQPIAGLESIVESSSVGTRMTEWLASGALIPLVDSEMRWMVGAPAAISHAIERSYLVDYDVEIAEAAAIHDAIMTTAMLGVAAAARADVIDDDEVLLHFAARNAAEKSPARIVDASARVDLAIESRLSFERREPGTIEAPVIEFQTLAGAARLQKGRPAVALVAPIESETGIVRGLLVEFELVSLSAAAAEFESGGRFLAVVDLAARLEPRFEVPVISPFAGSTRGSIDGSAWEGAGSSIAILHSGYVPETGDLVADRLASVLPESVSLSVDSGFAFAVSPSTVGELVTRAATSLESDPSRSSLLGLTAASSESSRAASVAFAMPIAGRRFLAICGVEQNLLVDADVEVANRTAIANPTVVTMLFGRFLQASTAIDAFGSDLVDLHGFGRTPTSAIDNFNHNASASPRFERIESCSTRFGAVLEFGAGRNGDRIGMAFPVDRKETLDLELKLVTP